MRQGTASGLDLDEAAGSKNTARTTLEDGLAGSALGTELTTEQHDLLTQLKQLVAARNWRGVKAQQREFLTLANTLRGVRHKNANFAANFIYEALEAAIIHCACTEGTRPTLRRPTIWSALPLTFTLSSVRAHALAKERSLLFIGAYALINGGTCAQGISEINLSHVAHVYARAHAQE